MALPSEGCIDAHAHLVPARLVQATERAASKLSSVTVSRTGDGGVAISFPSTSDVRPIPPAVLDRERSHAWMDTQGIAGQVVGVWADLFAYDLPAVEAAYWTRLVNDLLLEETVESGRMAPLAILPLQETALALEELDRVLDLGYTGVTIGCSAGVDELDHDRLDDLWAALADRQVPVVMHPAYRTSDARARAYGLPNTLGRAYDTDVAVARLLYSGRLAKHPGVRLVLMHGGGAVPYLWGRMQRNHTLGDGPADPVGGLGSLYFDSVVYREQTLAYLVDFAGADRVLLGSDYPFPIMDPEPLRVVRELAPSAEVRARLCADNARELFTR